MNVPWAVLSTSIPILRQLLTEHASRVIVADDANHRSPTRAITRAMNRFTRLDTPNTQSGLRTHTFVHNIPGLLPLVSSVLRNDATSP
jgi:hypothetical protein